LRRTLVTGGAGFIGSSLVDALMVSKNYQVTVLDNLSRGSKENISSWLVSPNFKFVLADVLEDSELRHENKSTLQQAVDNSDIIFHLAANPDVVVGSENTRIDFRQNVQATYNLLEAIRKSQLNLDQYGNNNKKKAKQLIFASSSTVYGEADKRPTPENYSPLHPISLYGAMKLAGEAIISGYSSMFGIQCVVARLANIIGARNTHGVVYDFITKLSSHPDYLDILGNGLQNKSYLHIDDCISALILLSERMQANLENSGSDDYNENNNHHQNTSSENKKIHQNKDSHQRKTPSLEVFNVGSDDTINVIQIAQIVIDKLSLTNENVRKVFKDDFEGGRGWKGDVPEFWLDCSKLKAAGWRPKYGKSRDAVIQTCSDYLNSNKVEGSSA
jgi:UDP-glucose 4-epimerase